MELNLNAARRARAARRNQKDGPFPLYFGVDENGKDKVIAMLPAELPLHALAPLTEIDLDMAYLLHVVKEAFAAGSDQERQGQVLGQVIDLLVRSPDLPASLFEATKAVGVLILGEDGYEAFMAEQPSVPDVGELVKGLAARWGVGRGESLPPVSGSPSGESSTPTSGHGTGSTSTESGTTPEIPASSESMSSSSFATSSPMTPG